MSERVGVVDPNVQVSWEKRAESTLRLLSKDPEAGKRYFAALHAVASEAEQLRQKCEAQATTLAKQDRELQEIRSRDRAQRDRIASLEEHIQKQMPQMADMTAMGRHVLEAKLKAIRDLLVLP